MGEWRYSSTFPDLGTRWRWVVSFTPMPLCRRGKSLRYPLERRLGRPQSRSGRCGGEKNLALPEIESGRPARSPSLYRLSYPDSYVNTSISFQIHFSVILLSMPRYFKWALSFRFSDQNVECTSVLSHACYMSRPNSSPLI
jgi:hypothetical protein